MRKTEFQGELRSRARARATDELIPISTGCECATVGDKIAHAHTKKVLRLLTNVLGQAFQALRYLVIGIKCGNDCQSSGDNFKMISKTIFRSKLSQMNDK